MRNNNGEEIETSGAMITSKIQIYIHIYLQRVNKTYSSAYIPKVQQSIDTKHNAEIKQIMVRSIKQYEAIYKNRAIKSKYKSQSGESKKSISKQ